MGCELPNLILTILATNLVMEEESGTPVVATIPRTHSETVCCFGNYFTSVGKMSTGIEIFATMNSFLHVCGSGLELSNAETSSIIFFIVMYLFECQYVYKCSFPIPELPIVQLQFKGNIYPNTMSS